MWPCLWVWGWMSASRICCIHRQMSSPNSSSSPCHQLLPPPPPPLPTPLTPAAHLLLLVQGMGEPLNNYNAVKAAVGMMTDPRLFGLRRKKVTVSTVGVIPRLLEMADDMPGVRCVRACAAPLESACLPACLPEPAAPAASCLPSSIQLHAISHLPCHPPHPPPCV